MLSQAEFEVLYGCLCKGDSTQRGIAARSGLSLGNINAAVRSLRAKQLISADMDVTAAGKRALAPYKVDNAVIMAAGLSSRFVPISYEQPKGTIAVKGEVMIERQIRQLHEAGVTDIIVVVGYRKEDFFYLEDEFGVSIVINEDYAVRNNNSTIKRVADRLGNTYICSSDNYFAINPFEPYVYQAYYAAVFMEGETDEYCLVTHGKNRRIVDVVKHGEDEWVMMGHAYWDRAYSAQFLRVLDQTYNDPETASKLWEDIYIDHIKDFTMVMRCYERTDIWEFDSVDELVMFDPDFMEAISSSVFDNICATLNCTRHDIHSFKTIKKGLTNLTFSFYVGDEKYTYRLPGTDASSIVNRESEAASEQAARELGIDPTFLHLDVEQGWKIARFIPALGAFDMANEQHTKQAMELIRTLHTSNADTGFSYDPHEETVKLLALMAQQRAVSFRGFDEMLAREQRIHTLATKHGARVCLCHNDLSASNFLVTEHGLALIDWEYSGMSDYASDLASFACESDYSYDEMLALLRTYFQRDLAPVELFHCMAYMAIVCFHWLVWALFKESNGNHMGQDVYRWYRHAKDFGQRAEQLAEEFDLR